MKAFLELYAEMMAFVYAFFPGHVDNATRVLLVYCSA